MFLLQRDVIHHEIKMLIISICICDYFSLIFAKLIDINTTLIHMLCKGILSVVCLENFLLQKCTILVCACAAII